MSKAKPMSRDLDSGDPDTRLEVDFDGQDIWIGDGAGISLMLKPQAIVSLMEFCKDVETAKGKAEKA